MWYCERVWGGKRGGQGSESGAASASGLSNELCTIKRVKLLLGKVVQLTFPFLREDLEELSALNTPLLQSTKNLSIQQLRYC